jgi:hypothetical protein
LFIAHNGTRLCAIVYRAQRHAPVRSGIPPHLSLPAFQHSRLSLSREHKASGYIENGKKQQSDLYRQMDSEDPLLAEGKALPARGAAPQRGESFPAHAYQNSAQSGNHGIDREARDQI